MPVCKLCDKQFKNKTNLERHVEKFHQEGETKCEETPEEDLRVLADILEDLTVEYSSVEEMLDDYPELYEKFKEKVRRKFKKTVLPFVSLGQGYVCDVAKL